MAKQKSRTPDKPKTHSIRLGSRTVEVKDTILDRAINYLSPVHGARRLRARFALEATAGGYTTHKKKRNLGQWRPSSGDADTDLLGDLPDLRDESRDLERTSPLAAGIFKTKVTNIIGAGLQLNAAIDREVLGLSDEQAEEIEGAFEREWELFAESQECDLERTSNFDAKTREVLNSRLQSGDVLTLLPFVERPGSPYGLKIQVVEGDRLSNKDWAADSETCVGGVEKDEHGAPLKYWISTHHPGNALRGAGEWEARDAFSASGRRQVLHIFDKRRPGQTRGVPDLAAVIEPLKQVTRYVGAELDATVVSSFFTIAVKTATGENTFAPMQPTEQIGGSTSDNDWKLGPAAVLGLASDEAIEQINPLRPNQAFDGFVQAVFRQIGVGVELPFEILIKHFTASYSAARAAILEAWKYFMLERSLIRDQFCQPVYEALIYEAVARGRVNAPGFLTGDPLIRKAYLGTRWIGPGRGLLNEVQEVEAAVTRIENNLSTKADETAAITGGNYERNVNQRRREIELERGMPQPGGAQLQGARPSPDDGSDLERADRPDGDETTNHEELRAFAETHGIGVRAGLVTPQSEDEQFFRERAKLPPMSSATKDKWSKFGGTRDPITLREEPKARVAGLPRTELASDEQTTEEGPAQ